MFAQITTPDIERELRRRGLYTEAVATPFIPEAPATPVQIIPGPAPEYREPILPDVPPYLPAISPEVTPGVVPERDLWLPGGPPTRAEEARISKTALIAGGLILAAIILFTHEGGAKRPGKKKPALRRRTIREEFRPEAREAI
jgi:hypothetical protein